MIKRTLLCLLSGSLLWASTGCRSGSGGAPDISKVDVPYQSFAFYKEFSSLDTAHLAQGLQALKNKYPDFTDFYLDTLAGFGLSGAYNDTNAYLKSFFTHKDYKSLQDTVNIVYPQTQELDRQLMESFKYVRYYDSSFHLPQKVYYFVSGLNGFTAVYQNENNIGIGLDMFLGADFAPYAAIGIPAYAVRDMKAQSIPVWVMKMIYEDKYPFREEGNDLLSLIIQKGKEAYFLKKTIPYLDDATLLGYTEAQWKWCEEHEPMIYNFFIQNKLLYEKDLQKTARFITGSPNTPGMPTESPGNIGTFVGLKIIESYMDKHSISMHELLEHNDPQKLLSGAKYKP